MGQIEELSIIKKLLITGTPYPPKEELEHFNNCDGCSRCDYMLEFFGQCSCCDIIIDKSELYYDHPVGEYYCEDCAEAMPDNNTNEFAVCGGCHDRFKKATDLIYDYYNFPLAWACHKCVYGSVVHNRFEILDL